MMHIVFIIIFFKSNSICICLAPPIYVKNNAQIIYIGIEDERWHFKNILPSFLPDDNTHKILWVRWKGKKFLKLLGVILSDF